MIYYPQHLRYVGISLNENEQLPPIHIKTPVRSDEWKLSIILSWVTVIHLYVCSLLVFLARLLIYLSMCLSVFVALTTAYLLGTVTPSPIGTIPPQISAWATFLGISSATLATIQYAPQLLHTYRMKLVGALSIPMMMIQTPGGILMITSIVLRPGTNWTSELHFDA